MPLGLKSSPSRVTQRVLTSLLKARDLAVAASCRRSMAALRLQRHPLSEHQHSRVSLSRGQAGPSGFAQHVLAVIYSLRIIAMAMSCMQVHRWHGS